MLLTGLPAASGAFQYGTVGTHDETMAGLLLVLLKFEVQSSRTDRWYRWLAWLPLALLQSRSSQSASPSQRKARRADVLKAVVLLAASALLNRSRDACLSR